MWNFGKMYSTQLYFRISIDIISLSFFNLKAKDDDDLAL